MLRPDRSPERRPPEPPPDAGDSESESGRMNYSPSDGIRSAQLYFKRILINVYNKSSGKSKKVNENLEMSRLTLPCIA